jgi:hypothetical protein
MRFSDEKFDKTQKSVNGQIRRQKLTGKLRPLCYWSFVTHASISSDEDIPLPGEKAHTKHEDLTVIRDGTP